MPSRTTRPRTTRAPHSRTAPRHQRRDLGVRALLASSRAQRGTARVHVAEWRWVATNRARYAVGASSYPRHRFSSGFYPIFALSVLAFTCAFWLRARVRAWAGQGRDRATEFFGVATSLALFSQKELTVASNSFSWPSKRLLRLRLWLYAPAGFGWCLWWCFHDAHL